jgi:hypothetical protein
MGAGVELENRRCEAASAEKARQAVNRNVRVVGKVLDDKSTLGLRRGWRRRDYRGTE